MLPANNTGLLKTLGAQDGETVGLLTSGQVNMVTSIAELVSTWRHIHSFPKLTGQDKNY